MSGFDARAVLVTVAAWSLHAAAVLAQGPTGEDVVAGPAAANRSPESVALASLSSWTLRVPLAAPVVFRGAASFDDAGVGAAPILYPAPDLATGLIAMLTHGAVVSSAQASQKSKLQEEANKILDPYRPLLAGFTHADLARRALALAASGAKAHTDDLQSPTPGGHGAVASEPVFELSQDQRALVLTNFFTWQATSPGAPPLVLEVRVVSQPVSDPDPHAHWAAGDGDGLRGEAARLLAQSLDIAWAHRPENASTTTPPSGPQKTLRYLVGTSERVERGTVMTEACGRVTARTLRGGYLSAPLRDPTRPVAGEPCP